MEKVYIPEKIKYVYIYVYLTFTFFNIFIYSDHNLIHVLQLFIEL